MCFYYSLNKMAKRYQERAADNEMLRKMDLVNGFKYPEMPVITSSGLEKMHWGLIPFWAKDDSIRQYTLNARAESLYEKPSFKKSIVSRRCLIPATGFFEWKHTRGRKQPYYIHLKKQEVFTFAGIWDEWRSNSTGEILRSFSIITTDANPLLAQIHNTKKRMPAVLTREIEFDWTKEDLSPEEVSGFLNPLEEDYFEAWPVRPFDRDKENQEGITQPVGFE